jgi:hypothetical protein
MGVKRTVAMLGATLLAAEIGRIDGDGNGCMAKPCVAEPVAGMPEQHHAPEDRTGSAGFEEIYVADITSTSGSPAGPTFRLRVPIDTLAAGFRFKINRRPLK